MKTSKFVMIGKRQARIGYKFLFKGVPRICVKCKRYGACAESLEEGRVYEVNKILKKIFPCQLHGLKIVLVEVQEVDYLANIDTKSAVLNALIKFTPLECEVLCPEHFKCVPLGLVKNDRCRIIEVKSQIKCLKRRKISSVQLRRNP